MAFYYNKMIDSAKLLKDRYFFGSYLLGGFLFVDRSESSHGTHLGSLNPGFEIEIVLVYLLERR
ncbi:hypothetical protein [Legionella jamestowniensis]|uniref:hypothetical protein n=1 Tax=Legionella jamestowniensis TaxID=455 RepID=UPI000A70821C|nr:hypothetical protein [Legionella jamestowniensis]